MNWKKTTLFTGFLAFSSLAFLQAQEKEVAEATSYRVEAFGSVGTDDHTPFWMTSNRYGVVPLDAGNGYLEAGVFHNQSFGKGFQWSAGVELAAVAPRNKEVFIQQLYANIGYRAFLLSIGSQEKYTSLWDRNLSSGDLVQSANARPIPEINISIPRFLTIPLTKGWLHFKGDFAVGRSFDSDYLRDFVNDKQVYNEEVLWHHKSLFLKINDARGNFPFSLTLGVRHWVQWGGDNTLSGEQPHSFRDFFRIVVGKEGGQDATSSGQVNALGNHYGSYDFKLSYIREDWQVHAYYQHYFDDKSGMQFYNGTDGLWGIELQTGGFPWIRKVVVEYLNTKNQSGPIHYIAFDHEHHPGRGGGGDDYYNHGEYTTGVSYFNRAIGSPLLISPEYNEDGSLGFKSSRMKDWHIAFEGELSPTVAYRVLFTQMNGWGTPFRPYLSKKSSTSGSIDISYKHPRLKGWEFKGSVAGDTGSMLGDQLGFSLSISKRGFLKEW